MKVLQVISSGGMYGAEAVVLQLAIESSRAGRENALGIFSNSVGGDLQLHHEALARGLTSHLLPCHGQFDRKMFSQLREIVHGGGFDIVHAHGYKADVYAYLALRSSGVPLVSTCHSWMDSNAKVRAYGIADRFVLRSFAGVASVSEAVTARLIQAGVRPHRIRLIPNGIDPQPFTAAEDIVHVTNLGQAPVRIGLIGRLTPEKGVDLFLRSAASVLKEHPGVEFLVAGDGPDRESLASLSKELGIEPNVTFLGRCDTIPSLLSSLDLVVSASRLEGLPIALLEAMASGRAIIATNVGEVAKVLDAGNAGVVVPPEDVSSLANAMTSLIQDPDRRRQLATAGHNRVLTYYSAKRMAGDYLEFYAEAIEDQRRATVA